jgi:ABC-type transporter MlaC component
MTKFPVLGFFVALSLLGPLVSRADETASDPSAELKSRMEELFDTSKKVNAPGGEGVKARENIRGAMDWDRIAQDAIGHGTWKKQPAKRQTEFKMLLREVVEKTAYSRLDKFWTNGTTYKFQKIDFSGGDAHVPARFLVSGKGFTIDYYLAEKGKKWLIHDIAYEGLRYSENIHEQINAFLKEKPFAQLLEKLRKRRDELSEEDETKQKSS